MQTKEFGRIANDSLSRAAYTVYQAYAASGLLNGDSGPFVSAHILTRPQRGVVKRVRGLAEIAGSFLGHGRFTPVDAAYISDVFNAYKGMEQAATRGDEQPSQETTDTRVVEADFSRDSSSSGLGWGSRLAASVTLPVAIAALLTGSGCTSFYRADAMPKNYREQGVYQPTADRWKGIGETFVKAGKAFAGEEGVTQKEPKDNPNGYKVYKTKPRVNNDDGYYAVYHPELGGWVVDDMSNDPLISQWRNEKRKADSDAYEQRINDIRSGAYKAKEANYVMVSSPALDSLKNVFSKNEDSDSSELHGGFPDASGTVELAKYIGINVPKGIGLGIWGIIKTPFAVLTTGMNSTEFFAASFTEDASRLTNGKLGFIDYGRKTFWDDLPLNGGTWDAALAIENNLKKPFYFATADYHAVEERTELEDSLAVSSSGVSGSKSTLDARIALMQKQRELSNLQIASVEDPDTSKENLARYNAKISRLEKERDRLGEKVGYEYFSDELATKKTVLEAVLTQDPNSPYQRQYVSELEAQIAFLEKELREESPKPVVAGSHDARIKVEGTAKTGVRVVSYWLLYTLGQEVYNQLFPPPPPTHHQPPPPSI